MSDAGDEPEGTFSSYFAEGDILSNQEKFYKAIDAYTKV